MTIREMEARSGLTRSNIRFYEKEGLMEPARGTNGYRNYSEEDLKDLKRILLLRSLGLNLGDIRAAKEKNADLEPLLRARRPAIEEDIRRLEQAGRICDRMLQSKSLPYDALTPEKYLDDYPGYVRKNRESFLPDSVSFLYLWGSFCVWITLTALCLLAAVCSFENLPAQIPVQWSGGVAVSFADRKFIFAYPAACPVIYFLLRPFLFRWLSRYTPFCDSLADYAVGFLCFVILSVELFTVLFVLGYAKNITAVLSLDAAVFLLFLAADAVKIRLRKNSLP